MTINPRTGLTAAETAAIRERLREIATAIADCHKEARRVREQEQFYREEQARLNALVYRA